MPFAPRGFLGVGVSISTSSNDGSSAAEANAYSANVVVSGLPSSS